MRLRVSERSALTLISSWPCVESLFDFGFKVLITTWVLSANAQKTSGIGDAPETSGHPLDLNNPEICSRSVRLRVGPGPVGLCFVVDVGRHRRNEKRGPVTWAKIKTVGMTVRIGPRTPNPISSPSQSRSDCSNIKAGQKKMSCSAYQRRKCQLWDNK
jgi:hypothetical protein